jgi:hypothetical protein
MSPWKNLRFVAGAQGHCVATRVLIQIIASRMPELNSCQKIPASVHYRLRVSPGRETAPCAVSVIETGTVLEAPLGLQKVRVYAHLILTYSKSQQQ